MLIKTGVIVLFATIALASFLTPNFNHLTQTISELNSKTAPYRIFVNTFFTIGFALILVYSIELLGKKETPIKLLGGFLSTAIAIMLTMTWFFPMDASVGIRTSSDEIHNTLISVAVVFILLGQIFQLWLLNKAKEHKKFYQLLTMFVLALVFGLLSLYANLNMSEMINLVERGWAIIFLIYLFNLPDQISQETQTL